MINQILKIIEGLSSFTERGYQREIIATDFIIKELEPESIEYSIQSFKNYFPEPKVAKLEVDGEKVDCLPTSFVSGKFTEFELIDSLSDLNAETAKVNINYNSKSDYISRPSFYNVPSLAISRKDVEKVKNATKVEAEVEVEKTEYTSRNILVGDINSPEKIIFCHLDSIGPSAVDNASGSALCLDYVLNHRAELEERKLLFVFSGNEEIAYDWPLYWGYGYRMFQEKYNDIFEAAQEIIAVDSVGHSAPIVYVDPAILKLGVPVKGLDRPDLIKKVKMLAGDINDLMPFYHSEGDMMTRINQDFLEASEKKLAEIL